MRSNAVEEWADSLSDEDMVTINSALNEILNGPDAIDEREFETRVGVSRERALALLAETSRITKKLQQ